MRAGGMLVYRDLAQLEAEPAARKLLHCVLLMAIRDDGRAVVFRPSGDVLEIVYRVGGLWHELVPAPGFVWDLVTADVRRLARLIRPPRPGDGLLGRLRGWFRRQGPAPEAGWLVYQFGPTRYEVAVLLNPLPPGPELTLRIQTPVTDRDAAGRILAWAENEDGLIEFEGPPGYAPPPLTPRGNNEEPPSCSPTNPPTGSSPSRPPGDTSTPSS